MRILFKSRTTNNINLYNFADIIDYNARSWKDGMTLSEWLNRSVEVVVISGGAPSDGVLKVGSILTLPGGGDFVRDSNREDIDMDYCVMTESGLILKLNINSNSTDNAEIHEIIRSDWMLRSDGGDYYLRNWRSLTGESLEPVSIDVTFENDNRLLSESPVSLPRIIMKIKSHGSRNIHLKDFKINGKIKDYIDYKIGDGSWKSMSTGDGIIRLDSDANVWRDYNETTVTVQISPNESEIHKLRDVDIHSIRGYIKNAMMNLNVHINHTGSYDRSARYEHTTDLDIYKSFSTQTKHLGYITLDSVKFKYKTDDPTNIKSLDSMLTDSSFNGDWFKLNSSAFPNMQNISRDDGQSLPGEMWMAGDNGSLYHVMNGSVTTSAVSKKKIDGSVRFSQLANNGVIQVSGKNDIHDVNDGGLCAVPGKADRSPVSYNNFAEVNIISNTPLTSMKVRTTDKVNYIPIGTLDCLRAEGETEWNTMMQHPMDVGDFFLYENDPEELEKTKNKPNHDYKIALRKSLGYLFDVEYPFEINRNMFLEVVTSTPMFDNLTNSIINVENSDQFIITLKRTAPRWNLTDIPSSPDGSVTAGHGNVGAGDTGMARLIARQTNSSQTVGILHENLVEHAWVVGTSNLSSYPAKANHTFVPVRNGNDQMSIKQLFADGPYGKSSVVMECTSAPPANGNGAADGGYRIQSAQPLDPDETYASVVFFRKLTSTPGGNMYHGCGDWSKSWMVNNLNGTPNGNPYFISTQLNFLTKDQWYVSVGFIRHRNDTDVGVRYGGVYDLSTGPDVQYANSVDYKHGVGNSNGDHWNMQRVFQFYTTSPSTIQITDPLLVKLEHHTQMSTFHRGFFDGFDVQTLTHKNISLQGAWKFAGSEDGASDMIYTEVLNGVRSETSHQYTAGVLYESSKTGKKANSVPLIQSGNQFNIPINNLTGGVDASDRTPPLGGIPGNAIRCVNSSTTINNNGTIVGGIENI